MSDNKNIRVRFAPSPTGHLHIGGARTALFNWLYARRHGGKFILRIEDTDRERSTEEFIEAILDGVKWLGLDWDEGPFRQTDRFDVYKKYADKLLAEGRAYHCYCSPEELDQKRKAAMAQGKPMAYDRKCKGIKDPPKGVAPSLRFAMPEHGTTVINDMVKGPIEFDNSQLDDLIIVRSDGTPTYNLVVVIDDTDMGITHVLRGDDHLNNTPKQVHIYEALGGKAPVFGHLPMILGPDKARLSKRHGATSVTAYREAGYLPEALINYLVRLGWSHGDQEVFSMEELIRLFSMQDVGKSAAIFNPEKLLWLNGQYIRAASKEQLTKLVIPFLISSGLIKDASDLDPAWLAAAVETLRERASTLVALASSLAYYIEEDVTYDEKAKAKFLNEKSLPYLKDLKEKLSALEGFSATELEIVFTEVVDKHEIKLRHLAQPVRVAMTGGTQSPGIFELLEVMGKQKTLRRLDRAMAASEGSEK